MWAPKGTLRAPLEPTWPSTGQRSEGGLHRAPGDLMDVSKTWVPGPQACAGPDPWWRPRAEWAEAGEHRGGTEASPRGGRAARAGSERGRPSAGRAFADAEKGRGAERGWGSWKQDKETQSRPKAGPRDRHLRGGRGSQSQPAGERAEPGGGRRARRASPFDPPRFLLSESAFGDTGTKAVHHITARPGGSLRSRRLIRGERVGPAGREEADSQAGTRGAGKGPACAPASAGARSGVGGGNRYLGRR